MRRILIVIIWTLLIAAVIIATIVLVALGRGYSYDFRTGALKLNGLAVFGSSPSGADIFVSGKTIRRRTPYRTTLEAGEYLFSVTKPGYRDWTKRITIYPSEVSWVQYILLIPTEIKPTTITTGTAFSLLTTSFDHHHFAYVAADGAVWIFDSDLGKPTKLYQPPTPAAGQPAEAVTQLAWSHDASHLLVTTMAGTAETDRLVSTSDSTSTDLTNSFGFNLTGLRFSPSNWQVLYWLSPEGLRQLNVGNRTVSAVLADDVVTYDFSGNQIIYVQSSAKGDVLDSMDQSGQNQRQLAALAPSPSYQLAIGSYRSTAMAAVLATSTRTITLYGGINNSHPTSKVLSHSADQLAFNTDGRFLNYENGAKLATYDLEKSQTDLFEPSPEPYQLVEWFDTYHLLVATAGELSLVEYDGGNATSITGAVVASGVGVTNQESNIISASPAGSDGQLKLVASRIKP